MTEKDYWYIACQSHELKHDRPIGATILDEWVVIYRDKNGAPVALLDRCLHRNTKLSQGRVEQGELRCPYHGWQYDGNGEVSFIPSEGRQDHVVKKRCAKRFMVIEKQGYIYVCLGRPEFQPQPFSIPQWQKKGWQHIRLVNHFDNTVTNCAENFVDVPHTVYVHPGIFRKERKQKLSAGVLRENGEVHVKFRNETDNLGWFSKFLNPKGGEIKHTDSFYMPNITCVEYEMGRKRHFFITSQSVPVSAEKTVVYTDLTYDYGAFGYVSRPVVRRHAQAIIDQDIEILHTQMQTIKKYGQNFQNSRADIVHVFIESIREQITNGRDPKALPRKSTEIDLWV